MQRKKNILILRIYIFYNFLQIALRILNYAFVRDERFYRYVRARKSMVNSSNK